MVPHRDLRIYRQDARTNHRFLTPKQREVLLMPYLPVPPKAQSTAQRKSHRVRGFLKLQFYLLVYFLIHLFFSVYVRIRQTHHVVFDKVLTILYYHHRAPELIRQDVKGLTRLPEHLSVILELRREDRGQASIEALMDEVAEISAWCACVGISMLSIYERTGAFSMCQIISGSRSDNFQGFSSTTYRILMKQSCQRCMLTLEEMSPHCKSALQVCCLISTVMR